MSTYRRPPVTGAMVFFTVALAARGGDVLLREVGLLREAVRVTRAERPFGIEAWGETRFRRSRMKGPVDLSSVERAEPRRCCRITCTRCGRCRRGTGRMGCDGAPSRRGSRGRCGRNTGRMYRGVGRASARHCRRSRRHRHFVCSRHTTTPRSSRSFGRADMPG